MFFSLAHQKNKTLNRQLEMQLDFRLFGAKGDACSNLAFHNP
jgi:hypothetical protein